MWHASRFDALTPGELYAILRLRSEIFVVEQKCIYLDMDGRDEAAVHVRGLEDGHLVAYARVLPPGGHFDRTSIGRVVVASSHRGRGLGVAVVRAAMATTFEARGPIPLALAAQAHLEAMYAALGFRRAGEIYDEDGIPHVDMHREPVAIDAREV